MAAGGVSGSLCQRIVSSGRVADARQAYILRIAGAEVKLFRAIPGG